MSSRRQSSAYDSRHKGWRGPILENTNRETQHTDSANCCPVAGSSRQHRQSDVDEIDRYRSSIRRTIKSACHNSALPSSPNPRTASLPVVTWSQPSMVDVRTRRRAFDFGRPSRIYRDDSEEMNYLRRRSHLLLDELDRERQGNSQLRQEVSRLRGQNGRVESLVEEIDSLRINNESLAREIQTRREARATQQRCQEHDEAHRRTVHRFSRF